MIAEVVQRRDVGSLNLRKGEKESSELINGVEGGEAGWFKDKKDGCFKGAAIY